MRRAILITLLSALLSGTLFAQYDISLWGRRAGGKNTFIPWFIYFGNDFVADLRYGFDAQDSAGVFVGKSFEVVRKKLVLIPEAGMIVGQEYGALSPEVLVIADTERLQVFSQNQWAFGVHRGSRNFAFNFTDWLFNVRKWIAVGAMEQTFKEFSQGSQARVDLGLSIKFSARKTYVKLLPMVSLGPAAKGRKSVFVVVGYAF